MFNNLLAEIDQLRDRGVAPGFIPHPTQDVHRNGHSAPVTMFKPISAQLLAGHSDESRSIIDSSLRGTVKELAQLDGAFVVANSGFVVSPCRYLDAMVAIVVSESAMVRVFDNGRLIAEIIPELWLLSQCVATRPVYGRAARRHCGSRHACTSIRGSRR